MESQPQNPEFRNNPENFHPYMSDQCLLCSKDIFWPCRGKTLLFLYANNKGADEPVC